MIWPASQAGEQRRIRKGKLSGRRGRKATGQASPAPYEQPYGLQQGEGSLSAGLPKMRRAGGIWLLVSILFMSAFLGSAQEEDIDTASATLVLTIERALTIEVQGGPLALTIGAPDLQKRFVPLGSLQLRVRSLVNYQVAAYGSVSPQAEVGAVQLRVEEVLGPFEAVLAPEFAPLGPATSPLPLFTGGNNIGLGTGARLGLRLDLGRLTGPLAPSYTYTISFMVVER